MAEKDEQLQFVAEFADDRSHGTFFTRSCRRLSACGWSAEWAGRPARFSRCSPSAPSRGFGNEIDIGPAPGFANHLAKRTGRRVDHFGRGARRTPPVAGRSPVQPPPRHVNPDAEPGGGENKCRERPTHQWLSEPSNLKSPTEPPVTVAIQNAGKAKWENLIMV